MVSLPDTRPDPLSREEMLKPEAIFERRKMIIAAITFEHGLELERLEEMDRAVADATAALSGLEDTANEQQLLCDALDQAVSGIIDSMPEEQAKLAQQMLANDAL